MLSHGLQTEVQLLSRFKQQRRNQVDDNSCTFSHSDLRFERLVTSPIHEQVVRLALDMLLQEVVVIAVSHTKEVIGERLFFLLVLFKVYQHSSQCVRYVLRGKLQDFLAKRPFTVCPSTTTHENLHCRHGGAIPSHRASVKAKGRKTVLSTGIHAPADFDAELSIHHQVRKFFFQGVLQYCAEVRAVADGQIASVSPRT